VYSDCSQLQTANLVTDCFASTPAFRSDVLYPVLMLPTLAARLFVGLAVVLLPMMIAASLDFGVTWDAWERHHNGVNVWNFLLGRRPRAAFAETGGHVYPGLFDTICVALEPWIPVNRWTLRHIVNAIFGWIGIVYTGRLARRLFGPWTGVLAVVLLALSPRFFAHAMNNPKDAPFAAMSMVALFYISSISPRWPYVSLPAAVKISVALALALSVRAGALLYLGYFGLLVASYVVAERNTDWRRLADTGSRVLAITIGMLLLGTIFWPWAGGAPFTRPFLALFGASSYEWDGLVLYDRFEYPGHSLPWHYVAWWFLISTPPVVLVGAACSILCLMRREVAFPTAALWAIAIFPLAAATLRGSTVYDGVRHFLFVVPVLVTLAAAGWTEVHSRARTRWQRGSVIAVLAIGLGSAVVFMVRFHPNQGVYFNALVGGPRGAHLRYDLDYWGNCMLQGVEWAAEYSRSIGMPLRMTGWPPNLVELNAERYPQITYVGPSSQRHHLELTLMRGTRPHLRALLRQPAVHRVRTPDGTSLCIVRPGPAYGETGPPAHQSGPGAAPAAAGRE
jgi:hypothetical protein